MAVSLDNPFIIIFFAGTLFTFFMNHFLEFIDFKSRQKNGGHIPEVLKKYSLATDTFDEEKLRKIVAYEDDKYRFWVVKSPFTLCLSFLLVFSGFYPWLLGKIVSFTGIPSTFGSAFLCFFLFLLLGSVPEEIISIPFALFKEFVIEKKHGFSKMTPKLWIQDYFKEGLVTLVLSALLTVAAAFAFTFFRTTWAFILAALLVIFTFIMQIVYPKFIAPLFNKFSPLEDGELKDRISALLVKIGFISDGLFVMDASKRSGHSNAYFSGFGKHKRIVLYDTLINQLTVGELEAVLGHELGHFKLKHILKRLLISIPLEVLVLYFVYCVAQFAPLYTSFGFDFGVENIPYFQFVGLFVVSLIWGSVSEIFTPLGNIKSRRDEYAADRFSVETCENKENMINALIKLNSENLSELLPPKIYAFWNYSHPTLIERISSIEKVEVKNDQS